MTKWKRTEFLHSVVAQSFFDILFVSVLSSSSELSADGVAASAGAVVSICCSCDSSSM